MKFKKIFWRRRRSSNQETNSPTRTPETAEPLYWPAKTTNEFLPDNFAVTMPCKRPLPLGVGTLSRAGTVSEFCATDDNSWVPTPLTRDSSHDSVSTAFFSAVEPSDSDDLSDSGSMLGEIAIFDNQPASPTADKIIFQRHASSFLRVADLDMKEDFLGEDETLACSSLDADSIAESSPRSLSRFPNFHHSAVDPPPGVDHDPKERWVVLDDGCGGNTHAPVAPTAVRALARSGLKSSFDMSMWVADSKTARVLKATPEWNDVVWQSEGPIRLPEGLNESECFVWSGTFKHGGYGSDLPAVRSVGVINMNPRALLDLLVDSSRVKEYNKLCVGRTDLLTLQSDAELEGGVFGGVTKVMKSESQPPMLRSTLQFTSLMHARQLEDGSGYKMVTRAVTLPETKEDLANTLKSEILLGATILKRIEGQDNKCLFISVNHLRSPMVPTMIAKRIGLSAAVNFIGDLRNVADESE